MTTGTIGIGYAPVPSAPEHWMEQGTCTTMDPRIWDEAWKLATTYCNRCPVLDQCREWVLGEGYKLTKGQGVIAGMDPTQRDKQASHLHGFTKLPDQRCRRCGEIIRNRIPRQVVCADCTKQRNRANAYRWVRTCKQCGYVSKARLGKARLCAECEHLNRIEARNEHGSHRGRRSGGLA